MEEDFECDEFMDVDEVFDELSDDEVQPCETSVNLKPDSCLPGKLTEIDTNSVDNATDPTEAKVVELNKNYKLDAEKKETDADNISKSGTKHRHSTNSKRSSRRSRSRSKSRSRRSRSRHRRSKSRHGKRLRSSPNKRSRSRNKRSRSRNRRSRSKKSRNRRSRSKQKRRSKRSGSRSKRSKSLSKSKTTVDDNIPKSPPKIVPISSKDENESNHPIQNVDKPLDTCVSENVNPEEITNKPLLTLCDSQNNVAETEKTTSEITNEPLASCDSKNNAVETENVTSEITNKPVPTCDSENNVVGTEDFIAVITNKDEGIQKAKQESTNIVCPEADEKVELDIKSQDGEKAKHRKRSRSQSRSRSRRRSKKYSGKSGTQRKSGVSNFRKSLVDNKKSKTKHKKRRTRSTSSGSSSSSSSSSEKKTVKPAKRRRMNSPLSCRQRHIGSKDTPQPSTSIILVGLPLTLESTDLSALMPAANDDFNVLSPTSTSIVKDKLTGISRGFGFLNFETVEIATNAMDYLNTSCDLITSSTEITCKFSVTQRAHSPTPNYYLGCKKTIQSLRAKIR